MNTENNHDIQTNIDISIESQREQPQSNESMQLLQNLSQSILDFMVSLTKPVNQNPIDTETALNLQIKQLISSAKELELYFNNIQSKYTKEKNNIEIQQEIKRIKLEIENKDKLIEKYKRKVREWKLHFEPLYKNQNNILHSTIQVSSTGHSESGTPYSLMSPTPMGTPMPNTPSLLSSLSQPTPSPSLMNSQYLI